MRCITNNSIKHHSFFHTVKWSVLFLTIQFIISHLFAPSLNVKHSYLTHRTISSATTLGQSGPRSTGNEEVLHFLQSPNITGASPSDCLVSYPGHLLRESYLYGEMQSVNSKAPANWTVRRIYKSVSTSSNIHILFHVQAEWIRGTEIRKSLLHWENKQVTLIYLSLAVRSLLFKEQKQKEAENVFLGLSFDTLPSNKRICLFSKEDYYLLPLYEVFFNKRCLRTILRDFVRIANIYLIYS